MGNCGVANKSTLNTTSNNSHYRKDDINKDFDYLFKLLLIGDSGCGKSSLLLRYSDDVFHENYLSTIGVDFKIKTLEMYGKKAKLQVWDTAGQDRFKTITSAYYRGAHAILVVYDISNPVSFNGVSRWLREIDQYGSEDVVKILVGNKSDLEDQRKVSFEEGYKLAESYGMRFFETSAKASTAVIETFDQVTSSLLQSRLVQQQ
eukprot:TRINITY_DN12103_c0_g1_i1.p1 TRINITY_DN12103_c0_g1~~TRINITY_DN12103_c0_g1_i1.p1  ORF type:complete len:204 (-),score=41.26 TRINITY_DN12103_c0_g1_i1:120-731(-)